MLYKRRQTFWMLYRERLYKWHPWNYGVVVNQVCDTIEFGVVQHTCLVEEKLGNWIQEQNCVCSSVILKAREVVYSTTQGTRKYLCRHMLRSLSMNISMISNLVVRYYLKILWKEIYLVFINFVLLYVENFCLIFLPANWYSLRF